MKIAGKKINPYIVIIPIPRPDLDIIFKAKSILNYEKFEALCPRPKPPMVLKRGELEPVPDIQNVSYDLQLKDHAKLRTAWMVIESLSATEELVWELVKPDDPNTWLKWEQELKETGLSDAEQNRIFNGVIEAQGLDDNKIEEARQRFLASLPQEANT